MDDSARRIVLLTSPTRRARPRAGDSITENENTLHPSQSLLPRSPGKLCELQLGLVELLVPIQAFSKVVFLDLISLAIPNMAELWESKIPMPNRVSTVAVVFK